MFRGTRLAILAAALAPAVAFAQSVFSWQQVKDKFAAANPTLKAAQLNIDESRAAEITAYLRPNPDLSISVDGFQVNSNGGAYRPLSGVVETPSISYLHERQHKRELRRDTARESTVIAQSTYLDQERNLLFNLRNAFVQVLQAKAVVQNARQNLEYWERELGINRTRYRAGDMAEVDLDRLELADGAVRIGPGDGQRERAHGQDSTADAAQRPHAHRTIRYSGGVRLQRADGDDGRVPGGGAGSAAGPEGGGGECGTGAAEPSTGGGQRVDRSDFQHLVFAQSVVLQSVRQPDGGREHQHTAADFRPQPGREGAHADRYRAERAAAGGGSRRRC